MESLVHKAVDCYFGNWHLIPAYTSNLPLVALGFRKGIWFQCWSPNLCT